MCECIEPIQMVGRSSVKPKSINHIGHFSFQHILSIHLAFNKRLQLNVHIYKSLKPCEHMFDHFDRIVLFAWMASDSFFFKSKLFVLKNSQEVFINISTLSFCPCSFVYGIGMFVHLSNSMNSLIVKFMHHHQKAIPTTAGYPPNFKYCQRKF